MSTKLFLQIVLLIIIAIVLGYGAKIGMIHLKKYCPYFEKVKATCPFHVHTETETPIETPQE